jgi:small subunit ribosomal protein S17
MADEENEQETPETPGVEGAAEETAVEASDAAATEAAGGEAAEAVAEAPAPEPQLPPKERRQRTRAAKAGRKAVKVALTPEDRQAARDELRVKKAAARRVERARQRTKHKGLELERQATAPREHDAGNQKTRKGIVVSDRADKTITVRIDVARRHRRYEKIVRTSNTVHAHDESNDAHIGDTVIVRECRPLSRSKRWRLVEILERAK